jgi:hypothetical protein
MGVLARRGAACIFNPYHPAEGTEGYGNGIVDVSNGNEPSALKWGSYTYPYTPKYPLFSWWKGDNPSTGQTDGAWYPQGSGNRVSKKKGGGNLDIHFGLEVTGYGHIYGGYYQLYGGNSMNNYRATYLGSHVPYNLSGIPNPPFPTGTEFKPTNSAKETYKMPGQDPTAPIIYWYENTQTLNIDGTITYGYEEVGHSNSYDPTTDGWSEWYTDVLGYKHYWKETGASVDSEYFNENFNGSPYYYHNEEGLIPRDDEADDYPEFDISSTELTNPDSTQYGIYESANSQNIYNTYKFLCWNTPASDYPWRKDYKTMNFKLTAFRNFSQCDTGCSYAGKKFKFKLTYQEGDMAIALNGSNTYTGTPFYATKSTITWGGISTVDITVDAISLTDWDYENKKEVWTKEWDAETIGRGKARRLIDFYLESIEDS